MQRLKVHPVAKVEKDDPYVSVQAPPVMNLYVLHFLDLHSEANDLLPLHSLNFNGEAVSRVILCTGISVPCVA